MKYTKEQFKEKFAQLPKTAQAVILDAETVDIIRGIGTKYDLHVDQLGLLSDAISLVMYGFIQPKDFVSELEKTLGLTKIQAGDVAYEVDQKLFKKIREALRRATEAAGTAEKVAAETPVATRVAEAPKPAPATSTTITPTVPPPKEAPPAKPPLDPYRETPV